MSVNLQKGQKISLSKEGGGELTWVVIGIGLGRNGEEGPVWLRRGLSGDRP